MIIDKSKTREPLSEQQQRLVEATWNKHRMGLPTLVAMYSGLRKNELSALTWSDIDLTQKTIYVTKAVHYKSDGNTPYLGKPKSEASIATVTIPDMLVELLLTIPRRNGLLCPSAKGQLMSESAFKTAWKSYQHFLNIQAGGRDASRSRPKVQAIEPFTAHLLRHP